jgi:hypothetical protein
MHHLQLDLMDMWATKDSDYAWIAQLKDPFSRYIWLYPLKNKSSAEVAAVLKLWFGANGHPKIL